MKKIQVKVLNPEVALESEKMMVCCARLTQSAHKIKTVDDFMDLYNKSYKDTTADTMVKLPHPTIQKFGVINVVVVGASRRFLAQITRHENEVKFMSGSCQYSDYSGKADFVVPYDLMSDPVAKESYKRKCQADLNFYTNLIDKGVGHDDASYSLPQGLRNVLVISATPFQFKHMISQRVCRRNTTETRYVMLKIWEALMDINPVLFKDCGPFCSRGGCKEGRMGCKNPMPNTVTPTEFLRADYPLLYTCDEVCSECKASQVDNDEDTTLQYDRIKALVNELEDKGLINMKSISKSDLELIIKAADDICLFE